MHWLYTQLHFSVCAGHLVWTHISLGMSFSLLKHFLWAALPIVFCDPWELNAGICMARTIIYSWKCGNTWPRMMVQKQLHYYHSLSVVECPDDKHYENIIKLLIWRASVFEHIVAFTYCCIKTDFLEAGSSSSAPQFLSDASSTSTRHPSNSGKIFSSFILVNIKLVIW